MKLNFKNKICPNCKTENTFICEETEKLTLSLKGYKQLKHKPVYKCENCGFCSYDFDMELESETKDFVNGELYADILNYSELEGLEKLDNNIIADYNAYDFECASLVYALEEDFDKSFVALFRAIQLKSAIKEKFYLQMLRDKEELSNSQIAEYEKLDKILEDCLNKNFKNLINVFENTEKNVFEKLMLIEAFEIMDNSEKAEKMFNQVCEQVELPQDLKDYFITLLN